MKINKVNEAIELVKNYYYDGNGSGGNLHVVLDDGNLKDSDIEFCLNNCLTENDIEGTKLCFLLLDMSITQRNKLYNNYEIYAQ
jgi:hypothetical protein